MLRTPVIRRRPALDTSNRVPSRLADFGAKASSCEEDASFLIDAEIAIDLPRRHVLDIVAPLFALGRQEMLEEVLAERVAHQIVFLQLIERFAQIPRQFIDP